MRVKESFAFMLNGRLYAIKLHYDKIIYLHFEFLMMYSLLPIVELGHITYFRQGNLKVKKIRLTEV